MKIHTAIAAALLAASGAVAAQESATVAANPPAPVGQGADASAPPADAAATAGPALTASAPPVITPPDGVTPRADAPRQPVSSSDNNFFLRQAMLEREIRLLTLEARRKELTDEIAGIKDDAPAGQGGIVPGGPIIPVTAAPTAAAVALEPVGPPPPPPLPFALLSIYGGEGIYKADFAVGAARVSLARGGELPGGWTVHSVGPFEVVVRKAGRSKTLRLGG